MLYLELLSRLGNLPLAIEQARAYIDTTSIHIRNYLELYDANAKSLLERAPTFSNYRGETVFTTWEVSFASIEESNPKAARILLYCGFLAKNDLFIELFQYGLPEWEESEQDKEISIRGAIQKLRSYSLIKSPNSVESFSIHPMIHLWIQERSPTQGKRLTRDTVYLLYRFWRTRTQDQFEAKLAPHLDAIFQHFRTYYCSDADSVLRMIGTAPLRNQKSPRSIEYIEGWYLRLRAGAEDLWYTVVNILRGDDFARPLWHTMYSLGTIYRRKGLPSQSEALYRWTLAAAWNHVPKRHPASLTIAGDLAWSIYLLGDSDKSLTWYRWILRVRETILGAWHPATMGALKGIAHIYDCAGRHEQALETLEIVYERRLKRLGGNDGLTLNAIEPIADLLERAGYIEAAEWRIQYQSWSREQTDHDAKKSWSRERANPDPKESWSRKRVDQDPKETAILMAFVGQTLKDNKEEAQTWLIDSIPTLKSLGNYRLDDVLRELDLLSSDAEDYLRRHRQYLENLKAIDGSKGFYSRNHQSRALLNRNFGHHEVSLDWCFRVLQPEERRTGYTEIVHIWSIVFIHHVIANNFRDLNQHNDALEWYARAIYWVETIPNDKREWFELMNGLTSSLWELGRLNEARVILDDILPKPPFMKGLEYDLALELCWRLSIIEHRLGHNNALRCLHQLLVAQKYLHGERSLEVLKTLGKIARLHILQHRYDEAYYVLLTALEEESLLLSEDDEEIADDLYYIALTCWRSGRHQVSFHWYLQLLIAQGCEYDDPKPWIDGFQRISMADETRRIRSWCSLGPPQEPSLWAELAKTVVSILSVIVVLHIISWVWPTALELENHPRVVLVISLLFPLGVIFFSALLIHTPLGGILFSRHVDTY